LKHFSCGEISDAKGDGNGWKMRGCGFSGDNARRRGKPMRGIGNRPANGGTDCWEKSLQNMAKNQHR